MRNFSLLLLSSIFFNSILYAEWTPAAKLPKRAYYDPSKDYTDPNRAAFFAKFTHLLTKKRLTHLNTPTTSWWRSAPEKNEATKESDRIYLFILAHILHEAIEQDANITPIYENPVLCSYETEIMLDMQSIAGNDIESEMMDQFIKDMKLRHNCSSANSRDEMPSIHRWREERSQYRS